MLWHLTFSDSCCGSKECRHQLYIIQLQWNHELNVFKSCPHAIFYKWAKVHFVKKNEFTVLNSDFTNNYLQLAFIVVYATPPLTDGIITQSGFCPKAASHPLKSQTGKKQSTFFSESCPLHEPCCHSHYYSIFSLWRRIRRCDTC